MLPAAIRRRPAAADAAPPDPVRAACVACATIGLWQGIALYLLARAIATHLLSPAAGAVLVTATVLVPVLACLGWGFMRRRTLRAWLACAALASLLAAWHATGRQAGIPVAFPLGPLLLLLVPLLFVAHCLVEATDSDQHWPPRYATLGEAAWTRAVELLLAGVFVLLLVAILGFGAFVFRLVHFSALATLITRPWFTLPVVHLATGFAIGFTGAQETLVRSARGLVLGLLSALLPVLTPIVAIFLLGIPFSAGSLLWRHGYLGVLFYLAAFALVLLVNAAYGDGGAPERRTRLLRTSAQLAAVMLVPLVMLAAMVLARRVGAHGWTPPRVLAGACLLQASIYALGYAAAAFATGRWLAGIERVNRAGAVSFVLIGAMLLSPVADPARLSAASQLARVESGRTPPDRFDAQFLRFHDGRYGVAALRRIVAHPPATGGDLAARRAAAALTEPEPAARAQSAAIAALPPAELRGRIAAVRPAGAILPDALLRDAARRPQREGPWPTCLTAPDPIRRCDAVVVAGSLAAPTRIAMVDASAPWLVPILALGTDGHWHPYGRIDVPVACTQARAALMAGQVADAPAALPDIVLAGRHFRVMSPWGPSVAGCPTP